MPTHGRRAAQGSGFTWSKHLVEAHGGKIWVESDTGKGSSFIFELPVTPPKEILEQDEVANQQRNAEG